ncbi:acyl carrier protein [Actinacidiphila oryziradicis]|uniref:Acyl carrier protein n=1 Tax=Actinacidiphila oryziradicis TaxID=2571141 RepID=A0A4U0SBP1_9ACTN|nr:acyl carrier protein [Actinacidiphila oryziradicis]TKA06642.1 acyl carrier protein [Actinacidiphila oryziradicis]
MISELTYADVASLMKSCAGLTADPLLLESRPDTPFADFGLDSLGLLGMVAELEHRYGMPIIGDAEGARTPADFVDRVNSSLTVEA